MEQEIIAIIENSFPVKKGSVTPDTPLEEVIYDSMDFIELMAILSVRYKLRFEPKDIGKIKTIRDIGAFILKNSSPKKETLSNEKFLGF